MAASAEPLQIKHLPTADDLKQCIEYSDHIHPAFNDAHADMALCSREEIVFRVHSFILQLASGWFRALLSLPQCLPSYKASAAPELIHMVESERVIAGLLSIASGQALPLLDSFDFVEDLLHAAEKYDMPSVISIIRLAIVSPSLLDTHPIRVYGIACQWDWTAEAKLASTKTLEWDLLSPEAARDLAAVESPHLAGLMLLHRRRRDLLRAGLDSPTQFYANASPGKCTNCMREVPHVHWARMKHAWMAAAETAPADVASKAVLRRPELREALDAACPCCLKRLYNPEGTLAKLTALLDSLPTVVEVRHDPLRLNALTLIMTLADLIAYGVVGFL